ncbi:chemotaxis protein CheW [Mesorhizobium sp.]|jgi:purine-binding chemotaxis protein CheW|uniref:chemotaxis protein CheW n=1 Tax=Mesorhizobium sp. TaxID=1871066 RepID=UPI00356397A5
MSEQDVTASSLSGFLAVRCLDDLYALPVRRVAEIVRVPVMARVPQAPPALRGLANLRGAVMPIADLNGLLRLAAQPLTERARAVVIDAPAPFALLVETVEGIIAVDDDRIDRAASGTGADGGAFSADGRPVRILDIDALVERSFTLQAGARSPARGRLTAAGAHEDATVGRDMLASFLVGGQEYALPFAVVQEVVNLPPSLTALPGADAGMPGLMAFRGGLLPLLSLRALFGLDAGVAGSEKIIVTAIHGVPVGVVVDAVQQSVAVDPARLEAVPAIMAARIGGEARVKAIYRNQADNRLISVLDPDLLLNEETMRRLGPLQSPASRTPQSTAGTQGAMMLLAFHLGDDEFALPVGAVEEVALVPERMTRVPRTPDFLEGVINLRGDVLPVIDQRKRFDMPALASTARSRLIVVRSGPHRAGIIVDSVSDVLAVDETMVSPAPDLTGEPTRLIRSIVSLEDGRRIVMLLDPSELLTRAERSLLDTFQDKPQH